MRARETQSWSVQPTQKPSVKARQLTISQEGKSGTIDLSADDPTAIKAMLLFFYQATYKELYKNTTEHGFFT
jgi:hypothetical protein